MKINLEDENISNKLGTNTTDEKTILTTIQKLNNLFGTVCLEQWSNLLSNFIFPWFFSRFSNGLVWFVHHTKVTMVYDFLLRNIFPMSIYGYEEAIDNAGERKPFAELRPGLNDRTVNYLKLITGFNYPFVYAFIVSTPFGAFVLAPNDKIIRRKLGEANFFDYNMPFSTQASQPILHQVLGELETMPSLFEEQIDISTIKSWITYCVDKFNDLYNKVYDITSCSNNRAQFYIEVYLKRLLHWERIQYEIALINAMPDNFARKNLTFAVMDKIAERLDNSFDGKADERTKRLYCGHYLTSTLLEILSNENANPLRNLLVESLQRINENIISVERSFIYPKSLISGDTVLLSRYPHFKGNNGRQLQDMSIEDFIGEKMRALRNIHHGFSNLKRRNFSVLTATNGTVSDYLPYIPILSFFAILTNFDSFYNKRWR